MNWTPSKIERTCLLSANVPEWWIDPTLGLKPLHDIPPEKFKAYDACINADQEQKQKMALWIGGGIMVTIILISLARRFG